MGFSFQPSFLSRTRGRWIMAIRKRSPERTSLYWSKSPRELWVNLGDDGLREAAYRGG